MWALFISGLLPLGLLALRGVSINCCLMGHDYALFKFFGAIGSMILDFYLPAQVGS